MKKFLIFLVALVVVVCFGLTIYYFVRNDEVIMFNTKEVYVNVGDIVTLDDLGYNVKKQSKKTTYNYNAGGEEVASFVEFDVNHGYYVVNNTKGGDVVVTITTSNKKNPSYEILFHIGNGEQNSPYYLSNADDLTNIGNAYSANKYFSMVKSIDLTSSFTPIGVVETGNVNFTGVFNGNGNSINGLTVNKSTFANAGLFYKLEGATVTDLYLNNAKINGAYVNAGVLAGEITASDTKPSTIERVGINGANITLNSTASTVGALAGSVSKSTVISRAYAENAVITLNAVSPEVSAEGSTYLAGGLVGKLDRSKLEATYAVATINAENVKAESSIGGLVGDFVISATDNGTIRQSYAYTQSDFANFGSFIGKVYTGEDFTGVTKTQLLYLVGNYCVGNTPIKTDNTNTEMFKNLYVENNTYYIYPCEDLNAMLNVSEYVYYVVENTKQNWDSNAWTSVSGKLPTLKMINVGFAGISSEYVNKDITVSNIGIASDSAVTNGTALATALNELQDNNGIRLLDNANYDMTGKTVSAKALKNVKILGNNTTISNLTVNGCLFESLDNSTMRGLNFTNLTITGEAKGLIGKVTSTESTVSSIESVSVEYATPINSTQDTAFGGIAAEADRANLSNCSVSNLVVTGKANTKLGGLVGISSASVNGGEVEATLNGSLVVGGVVAENSGSVENISATIQILGNATGAEAYLGGVVARNSGLVNGNNANITIKVNNTATTAYVGGVAAENSNRLTNNTVSGNGIELNEVNTSFVGGVTATNNGTVANCYITATEIGRYLEGKNNTVAGLVATNNGSISESVVTSNISGNVVAGAVVSMNANSSMDQVLVGFNTKDGKRNTISGDRFVAGVAYELRSTATISNIQTRSELVGKSASITIKDNGDYTGTIVSLVVLKFPNGATFTNATIDNIATGAGAGTLYKETWSDYRGGYNNNYNIYGSSGAAGTMKAVVIVDNNHQGFRDTKQSFFTWTAWNVSYDSGKGNFAPYVNAEQYRTSSTFEGTYTLRSRSKSWTYDLGFSTGVWHFENGVSLNFLNGGYAD